jgi:hypothetical protein
MSARKANPDRFVKLPIWLAVRASEVCKSPALLLVLTHMLDRSFEAGNGTFKMMNGWLEQRGVTRWTKNRVLRDLEAGRLISVNRTNHRSPSVTFIVL